MALATHKLASVALGIGASLRHFREGSLNWRFSAVILVSGLPGVVLGASIVIFVPDRIAELSLGILTAGLGIYSWLQPELGQNIEMRHRSLQGYLIGGAVLFCIGVLNGSLTSGTGLFVTLWLV